MDFRFLHAALPLGVVEKVQNFIKRLLGIVEHVGEGPPLPIAEKLPPRDTNGTGHGQCPFDADPALRFREIHDLHLQLLYLQILNIQDQVLGKTSGLRAIPENLAMPPLGVGQMIATIG
jgi:hypothetical protein